MSQQENNPRIVYRDAMDKIEKLENKIKVLPKEKSPALRYDTPGFQSPKNLGEATKSRDEYEQEKFTIESNLNAFLLNHFDPKTKEEHQKNIEKLYEEYLMSKEDDLSKYQDRFLTKESSQKNLDINNSHLEEKDSRFKASIGFYENYLDIKLQKMEKDFEQSIGKEKSQSKEFDKERD